MRSIFVALLASVLFALPCLAGASGAPDPLSLPPAAIVTLDHIYSGRSDLAIPEAQLLQSQNPNHPLGHLLEAEARWWKIWWATAEFKYGMTMARHREKLAADQPYLDLANRAYVLATARLAEKESADMYFYAGMADALAVRLYGLRGETRLAARIGVRARENLMRALSLDPSLADADFGLGLYNYYVDTLSGVARVLRFFMGIPGGSKAEGIRQLQRAIEHGELTPAVARFYLAIDLHNFDQRYEEALRTIRPLAEKYSGNPLFLLVQGDLYAKLGQKELALESYRAAVNAKSVDEDCNTKVALLVRESEAALGSVQPPPKP